MVTLYKVLPAFMVNIILKKTKLRTLQAGMGVTIMELEQGTVPGTFGKPNMGNGQEGQVLRSPGLVGPGTFTYQRNFHIPAFRANISPQSMGVRDVCLYVAQHSTNTWLPIKQ